MNPFEVVRVLMSRPEVTATEALQAGLTICEAAETGNESAIASLCQIVGFAATCGESELVRRFIVWQSESGPMDVGGAA